MEEVRPRTTSRSAVFRVILFYASLFLYNMWTIEHAKGGTNPREATLKAPAYSAVLVSVCNIIERPFDASGSG